jgi:hypothetical protein
VASILLDWEIFVTTRVQLCFLGAIKGVIPGGVTCACFTALYLAAHGHLSLLRYEQQALPTFGLIGATIGLLVGLWIGLLCSAWGISRSTDGDSFYKARMVLRLVVHGAGCGLAIVNSAVLILWATSEGRGDPAYVLNVSVGGVAVGVSVALVVGHRLSRKLGPPGDLTACEVKHEK